jgi:Flp pilus assembly protein TadD
VVAQVSWRQTQALVHAARGQHADAARLAREAITWAEQSDSPVVQGEALNDLGEVLEMSGHSAQAAAAWRQALDHYERKGIIPLARRVRERLASIQDGAI